ncbi:transcription factor HES-5-like [Amia ocellicauda]|uniref:transcription factor HES-5-like n=1 Tax=Amia ocellicauda TaxID=2972642 RepID=UPI003463F26E
MTTVTNEPAMQSGLKPSEATPDRKILKPLMEKKRRARINSCLEQLKTLLQRRYPKISKRKLEKADILEMTVKYLKHLQELHQAVSTSEQDIAPYIAGFQGCTEGVNYFLQSEPDSNELRVHLLTHLSNPLAQQEPASTVTNTGATLSPALRSPGVTCAVPSPSSSARVIRKPAPESENNIEPHVNSHHLKPFREQIQVAVVSKSPQAPHVYAMNSKDCPRTDCVVNTGHWRPW